MRKVNRLNYRFHNPNNVEKTANYLLDIFIETNYEKVEKAVRESFDSHNNNEILIAVP